MRNDLIEKGATTNTDKSDKVEDWFAHQGVSKVNESNKSTGLRIDDNVIGTDVVMNESTGAVLHRNRNLTSEIRFGAVAQFAR